MHIQETQPEDRVIFVDGTRYTSKEYSPKTALFCGRYCNGMLRITCGFHDALMVITTSCTRRYYILFFDFLCSSASAFDNTHPGRYPKIASYLDGIAKADCVWNEHVAFTMAKMGIATIVPRRYCSIACNGVNLHC